MEFKKSWIIIGFLVSTGKVWRKNKLSAFYIPASNWDNFSEKQVNGTDKWCLENQSLCDENSKLLKHEEIQQQFIGYLYNPVKP